MAKSALITGITGQDGAYLADFLLKKGYDVFGTYRRTSTPNFWRLQYTGVLDKIKLIPADMIDTGSILEAIKISSPDEIYNLAAQSFVGTSFEQPIGGADINGLGAARVLEMVRHINPGIKVYQASTSELFGTNSAAPQNEGTQFHPASPYAASKLYAYWLMKIYRDGYGIFACNGILFNHESPIRGLEFVTRKVTNGIAKILVNRGSKIRLGNLDAKRDWGYAPDYVKCMWMMLQQKEPDDYVLATNETHSVRELLETAFGLAGLDWREHVQVDKKFMRPLDVPLLQGDYSKAKKRLGWEPEVRFKRLVKMMLDADTDRWQRCEKGEKFPWDAFNYPDENNIITRTLKM
jgi:GDPmannose 4,6-dehydratase